MLCAKILGLIIIGTSVVVSQEETIWWSTDKVRIRSLEGNLISLPQCTANELKQFSTKYETCHREHLARIEQYYTQQADGG